MENENIKYSLRVQIVEISLGIQGVAEIWDGKKYEKFKSNRSWDLWRKNSFFLKKSLKQVLNVGEYNCYNEK